MSFSIYHKMFRKDPILRTEMKRKFSKNLQYLHSRRRGIKARNVSFHRFWLFLLWWFPYDISPMTATENIQRNSRSRTIATNFQSSLALLLSISSLVKAAMYLTLWMALFSSGHLGRHWLDILQMVFIFLIYEFNESSHLIFTKFYNLEEFAAKVPCG